MDIPSDLNFCSENIDKLLFHAQNFRDFLFGRILFFCRRTNAFVEIRGHSFRFTDGKTVIKNSDGSCFGRTVLDHELARQRREREGHRREGYENRKACTEDSNGDSVGYQWKYAGVD